MEITVRLCSLEKTGSGVTISEDAFNNFIKEGGMNKLVHFSPRELDEPPLTLAGAVGVIKETWRENNEMFGKIETLPTPNGIALEEIMNAKTANISISPTGYGKIEKGGKINDFTLSHFNINLDKV